MLADEMSVLSRLLGAVIGGGGGFAALHFQPFVELPVAAIGGAAGVIALLGLLLGHKIWEVVAQLA
jgi:hypothetical protein